MKRNRIPEERSDVLVTRWEYARLIQRSAKIDIIKRLMQLPENHLLELWEAVTLVANTGEPEELFQCTKDKED